MFAITWQYLSGEVTSRQLYDSTQLEWPPHPDRVFQALVGAWGERGSLSQEKSALEWLEQLPAPHISAIDFDGRDTLLRKTYVPPNDLTGSSKRSYSSDLVGLLPDRRSRKERTFCSAFVGDSICALIWPDADPDPNIRACLDVLCANVSHIGHSQSMVCVSVSDNPPPANWIPAELTGFQDVSMRVPHPGRLLRLAIAFADGGKEWKRPPDAPWLSYKKAVFCQNGTPKGHFDSRLLILRRIGGEGTPGLLQAPAFVSHLRKTLMKTATDLVMPLISGHCDLGDQPFEKPHVCCLPLPFVGHEHADGHLLGMAIALPREINADQEQAVYRAAAENINPETGEMVLRGGKLGTMVLTEEMRPRAPLALRPGTWTHASRSWGTVTPIVQDRHPPRRHRDLTNWAAGQVFIACSRQNLPEPERIDILSVSPFSGAPTCREFPPLLRKSDGGRCWHVHARIFFSKAIQGPILLGAGRYKGYGLCKPLGEVKS